MDLFTFHAPTRCWICKPCKRGVQPRFIQGHLNRHHRRHPTALTGELRVAEAQKAWAMNPLDTTFEPFIPPPPESRPIPGIQVFDGYACPEEGCERFATRETRAMDAHQRRDHGYKSVRRGAPARNRAVKSALHLYQPVKCQRMFAGSHGSSFFVVTPIAQTIREQQATQLSEADFVHLQTMEAIHRSDGLAADEDEIAPTSKDDTESSPWLELTRWPEYVRGHSFSQVAALAALPDPTTEPVLAVFELSIGRLIDAAYHSITTHRINEFDQVRINSFLQHQSVWNQPIQIRLRPATYRRYRQVWVRLISFIYRTTRAGQPFVLRHQLTSTQLVALDRMEEYSQVTSFQRQDLDNNSNNNNSKEEEEEEDQQHVHSKKRQPQPGNKMQDQLDHACLELSIALLDHELKGDIFESAIVGFMAALGVDAENQAYRDPSSYTGHLSALVKIAQMLVVQRAVQMADDGKIEYPSDALDDMRQRFLVYGVRAPFGWITRLRTYGKRIQSTTTSLGYLNWSDDNERLQYRDLQLSMTGLRRFVRTQVELAQWDLEQLFLLGEDDQREGVIPVLPLDKLTDDPVNNKRGWNFLKDKRNRAVLPTSGEQWLLHRVLTEASLRTEYTFIDEHDSQVIWRQSAVDEYHQLVARFLERLLLLVHVTAGQPARGTEIIALRHSNTPEGRHRSIFIEHGLVSTVTSYHKSQSITNSTKIIHRYLPRVVSELMVYYLWLIQPFTETISMLASGSSRRVRSPFLWASKEGHWDAKRLGVVLKQEAQLHLNTQLNVLSFRHAAIGISRMHLACGGFKRDYAADDQVVDQQAAHGSWVAGTVYARGLQEAPGVIESRRTRFRAISREWHCFLGFEPPPRPRKRGLAEDATQPPQKRREYVTIEISDDEAV